MSENVEGHDAKSEGKEKEQVDTQDLVQRLEGLERSYNRVLDESKTWKSKYQNAKAEADKREHAQLEESNDFKGLYEKTLAQVDDLKTLVQQEKKSKLETSLKYEVAKHGKNARDLDILLAAVKTKKKDLLGYDAENEQWKGVDVAVEDLRRMGLGLFEDNTPGMESGRPQAIVPKEKTVDDLIEEDASAVLRDALKQIL